MLSPNTASMSFQLSRMLSTPMAIGYSTLSRGSRLCSGVSLASYVTSSRRPPSPTSLKNAIGSSSGTTNTRQ